MPSLPRQAPLLMAGEDDGAHHRRRASRDEPLTKAPSGMLQSSQHDSLWPGDDDDDIDNCKDQEALLPQIAEASRYPEASKNSERYTRVFSTQWGGMGYKMARPKAKSRYLDFMKGNGVNATMSRIETRARENAMEFDQADADGDGELDFDEFKDLVHSRMPSENRTDAQLHAWMQALDTDGNGRVSKVEFFAFSLREAFVRGNTSQSMDSFFKEWDSGGDGQLNADEFLRLAERTGFGGIADELLAIVDADGSGVVEYKEFINMIRESTSNKHTKVMIMSAAEAAQRPKLLVPPPRAAVIQPQHLQETLLQEICDILLANGMETMEFLHSMDTDQVSLRASRPTYSLCIHTSLLTTAHELFFGRMDSLPSSSSAKRLPIWM